MRKRSRAEESSRGMVLKKQMLGQAPSPTETSNSSSTKSGKIGQHASNSDESSDTSGWALAKGRVLQLMMC